MKDNIYLSGMTHFHAARHLNLVPEESKSKFLHGHNFKALARIKVTDERRDNLESLNERIRKEVDDFNYSFINDHIPEPSDINIANKIAELLKSPSLVSVSVCSTDINGANIELPDRKEVWRSFTFQAAHQLPKVALDHKCRNMHGHTFRVVLYSEVQLENEQVINLEKVSNELKSILNKKCLNEIKGLENPTSEVLASWIWNAISNVNPTITKVEVMETDHSGCSFNGRSHKIWRQTNLESAISYNNDEEIYGYGYKATLYVEAPLDKVKEWVMDFGDVKELFKPVFQKMDHNNLNEIEGLEDPSIIDLIKWMSDQLKEDFPELNRLDLYESEGVGAELHIDKGRYDR